MVATFELDDVETYIYSKLSADTTLASLIAGRIFDGIADQGTEFPYVVYNFQSGHDVNEVYGRRVMTAATYLIKAIDNRPNTTRLIPIVKQIDALINGQSGSVGATGTILAAVRQSPVAMPEEDGGVQYRHRGGLYRFWACAQP